MELSRRILIILCSSLGLFPGQAFSSFKDSRNTPHANSFASLTQSTILRQFQSLYEMETRRLGKSFQIEVTREDSLSGSADYDGKTYRVRIPTTLLQNPRMNDDTLRIILCHEIGHLFGGSPRKNLPPDWPGPVASDGRGFMSSEGQADYYASFVCFRKVLQDLPVQAEKFQVPLLVRSECDKAWNADPEKSKVCQRAAVAGKNFLQLVREFPIAFETPDLQITPELIRDSYPSRQCRLDTLFRGALCPEDSKLVLDFFNENANGCLTSSPGDRPRCWYPN